MNRCRLSILLAIAALLALAFPSSVSSIGPHRSSHSSVSVSRRSCTRSILIIMSSANAITLTSYQNYSQFLHPTGFYLDELYHPLSQFQLLNYKVTFTNPQGNTPPMDQYSLNPKYFNNDTAAVQYAWDQVHNTSNFASPIPFSSLVANLGQLDLFDAVMIPGGHAPMVDLVHNPDLGIILMHFVNQGKPIGAICHGPVALLSTVMPGRPWPFMGRSITAFKDTADVMNEKKWGGSLPFLPGNALSNAGANVLVTSDSNPQSPLVIVDDLVPLLITGENPLSGPAFGQTFSSAVDHWCNSIKQ